MAEPQRRPNFLVVGAAKSGTTSLAHYLRQHPDVFVAREKESHYLAYPDGRPAFTGPGEASEFLPLIITDRTRYLDCFSGARQAQAVGEASVYYSMVPESFTRAVELNADMRFIMVLRDPLDRAYSAWSHQSRDGWETLDFVSAVGAEDKRVAEGWGFGWQYRRVSQYLEQLEAIRAMVPAERLHIMLYDDLLDDPQATMSRVYRFLGVDAGFRADTSLVLNASGVPRIARLNGLLARQNRVKEALKRVVPYRVGQQIQQRLRNWNLADTQLQDADREKVAALFDFDRARLESVSGCDLSAWVRA